MAPNRTRKRQLQRLAERRGAERRRARQRRVAIVVVIGMLGVLGVGSALGAIFRGGGEPSSQPSPRPTPTGSETASVACGGSEPAAASQEKPTFEKPFALRIDTRVRYRAEMETSCGTIMLDLLSKDAPKTVNNFIVLSRRGFFDGLTFHRVISGFMIQGGDPAGNGTGGPGYTFEDEFVRSLRFDEAGLIAMANSGPDTNGSQFFITVAPTPHLNGAHTIFGRVAEGMDVVERITQLPTDPSDRPVETVYIESIRITEVG